MFGEMAVSRVAPVPYADARIGLEWTRLVVAAVVTGASVVALLSGVHSAEPLMAGTLVVGHAISRLRHPGTSAFPSVLVDVSAASLVLLLVGSLNILAAIVGVYGGLAATLLLQPKRAWLMYGITSTWLAGIAIWAPLAATDAELHTHGGTPVWATIALIVAAAALLGVVGVRLASSRATQQDALDAEREAVRIKNEFVSMVSHELRTPLTSIAGFIETLREGWADFSDDDISEFLDIVHGEAQHLSHLVEDILVIPRIEAGRLTIVPERFELRSAVYRLIEALEGNRVGKSVGVEIPPGQMVYADPNRTMQVIRNLLTNAFKYGGDQILVSGERAGNMYQIEVSDNGPGVSEDDRDRIFDHFEQGSRGDARTASGIGLGLPIARKLVRAMGGDLWYQPRFPLGARFIFTIRATTAQGNDLTDPAFLRADESG